MLPCPTSSAMRPTLRGYMNLEVDTLNLHRICIENLVTLLLLGMLKYNRKKNSLKFWYMGISLKVVKIIATGDSL